MIWQKFIKAGRAVFTMEQASTDMRFTYKVKKHSKKDLYFVYVLCGPDNHHSYRYLGVINTFGNFVKTKNSRISEGANSFEWFKSLVYLLRENEELNSKYKIYHAGTCGRCGRRLTVPESIKAGFGPDCQLLVGLNLVKMSVSPETQRIIKKLLKIKRRTL